MKVLLKVLVLLMSSAFMVSNVSAKVLSAEEKANMHTHPANHCTPAIRHTHRNAQKMHRHRSSCKSRQRNVNVHANERHTHPANRCTRSISHSHPNGRREHKHRYSCKENGQNRQDQQQQQQVNLNTDPNAHTHPANSLTRSVRHTHPNGARKHTHHYGI